MVLGLSWEILLMVVKLRMSSLHAMFIWRVVLTRWTPEWRWNAAVIGLVWEAGGGHRGVQPSVRGLRETLPREELSLARSRSANMVRTGGGSCVISAFGLLPITG